MNRDERQLKSEWQTECFWLISSHLIWRRTGIESSMAITKGDAQLNKGHVSSQLTACGDAIFESTRVGILAVHVACS
jgi:hypothetical protein